MEMITEYVEVLLSRTSGIKSVWLFGSRANGTEHEKSDWDLMLFGSEESLEGLQKEPGLKREDIDVLVVIDGVNFIEPWPASKENYKSGDLPSWQWSQINHSEASYKATKYLSQDEWFKEGEFQSLTLKAIKLWPTR